MKLTEVPSYGLGWGLVLVVLAVAIGTILGMTLNGKD